MENLLLGVKRSSSVSYTHLDVYKRQLEAVGGDAGLEVAGDVGADLLHAVGRLQQDGQARGGAGQHLPVEVGQAAGQLGVGLVDGRLVDVEFHQPRLEVQRQRGPVADRLLEAVAAQVAVLVLGRAEGVEGVAVAAVGGRARQAEEEGCLLYTSAKQERQPWFRATRAARLVTVIRPIPPYRPTAVSWPSIPQRRT